MTILPLDDYNIYIGNDSWKAFNELIEKEVPSKIAVVVDENTVQHCLPIFDKNVDFEYSTIQIQAGEVHKNIETCQYIWQQMMELQFSRSSMVINLGGGVIGDMGGFCASTFKRGMRFVQMPTTLLSQVDASIGGKLGIDFMDVKNSIGVFRNPQAVFVNPDFLKTLSDREVRSGFAEMIKHSLIADANEWEVLSKKIDLDNVDWNELILNSLKVKQKIVAEDPFEQGIRKALNFGHTVGHAIESQLLNSDAPLLHGEAIAIGMICEAYLSHLKVGLPVSELEKITDFIQELYGKSAINPSTYDDLIAIMRHDKKNIGNEINFTFLPKIGACAVNQKASPEEIMKCLDFYNNL